MEKTVAMTLAVKLEGVTTVDLTRLEGFAETMLDEEVAGLEHEHECGYYCITHVEGPAHPVRMLWKDEGEAGPLWFVGEYGRLTPFVRGEVKPDGRGFHARWFTLGTARVIAKEMGLPLEVG